MCRCLIAAAISLDALQRDAGQDQIIPGMDRLHLGRQIPQALIRLRAGRFEEQLRVEAVGGCAGNRSRASTAAETAAVIWPGVSTNRSARASNSGLGIVASTCREDGFPHLQAGGVIRIVKVEVDNAVPLH